MIAAEGTGRAGNWLSESLRRLYHRLGAAGGTAAKVLTEGGLEVVMLEAGPMLDPAKDYKEHVWPYELAHRGAGIAGVYYSQPYLSEFTAPNALFTIKGEPYTNAPDTKFMWLRSRIVGGRTNHWARSALCFAEVDFKGRSTDGERDDWPVNYQDLALYYDKVGSFIGVFGSRENIHSAPDGIFLPPPKPRCTELTVKKACDTLQAICQAIMPSDDRSGGALEAGAPEFIDLLTSENEDYQRRLGGGLMWLDAACLQRYHKLYLHCSPAEQKGILDHIAYRANAEKDSSLAPGIGFFAFLRDLTVGGYFNSEIGIKYLGYIGNTFLSEFPGCPPLPGV